MGLPCWSFASTRRFRVGTATTRASAQVPSAPSLHRRCGEPRRVLVRTCARHPPRPRRGSAAPGNLEVARVSPADKTAAPALVRLADVRKTYAVDPTRVEVLRGVDLQVDAGDLLAVTEPSGAGKSTLMNILGLLDRATSGMHLLESRDVLEMDDDRLSATRGARIGFVFQSFQLLPRLTALENVGLPLAYRRLGDVEIKRCCLAALAQLGMAERASHRPGELSGGQQQRVAIARALVGEPAVLLADEPTGALDQDTGREIMRLFGRLNEERGLTVIVITHDPAVARQCRRHVRIEDGVLREEGVGAERRAS